MAIRRSGPENSIDNWASKIHDIMDEMLNRNFVHFRQTDSWQPATNVYETCDAYYLCLELAGMRHEEITVNCEGATRVVVRGRRAQPRPAQNDEPLSVHALEIDEGEFRRTIELAAVINVNAVDASYDKGFLWIKLPKSTPSA